MYTTTLHKILLTLGQYMIPAHRHLRPNLMSKIQPTVNQTTNMDNSVVVQLSMQETPHPRINTSSSPKHEFEDQKPA